MLCFVNNCAAKGLFSLNIMCNAAREKFRQVVQPQQS
jgi:hypothetical protein